MVHGHQGPRCKSALHERNLPSEVQVQCQLPYRYVLVLVSPRICEIIKLELEPPEVTFVKLHDRPIPIHPHIYTNGFICLDLLGQQGWSPVQNVQSVCMSIQSMLTGNTKNERPPGDEEFVKSNRLSPRNVEFYYHDNTI
jgi:hypothetical protein